MKAVLLKQAKDIDIVDIQRQEQKEKVAIKVGAVGICGSDIAAYKGLSPLVIYPCILGHEVAGEIVSIPDKKSGIDIGERVIVEPYMYCGMCYPCKIGRTNCCENMRVIGVHEDGGMREYFSHDPKLIHKVPDSLPWEHVPMVEPLSIAIHGIHRLEVQAGEHVAITGAGPIGLLAAQVALYLDAVPILIDPIVERLELAQQIGVLNVLNPTKGDLVKEVQKITGGRMAEAVLEASGAPAAVRSSLDLIHYAGRIALLGWPKEEISLPTYLITRKELDVRGSRNSAKEFPLAIELLAKGAVKVKPIITHIIDLDEVPEYVRLIAENPQQYVKVIAKVS
jgi:2-desacetyl-2-hydroxyethyl bacteriochlorophyllide A dehydrogenase